MVSVSFGVFTHYLSLILEERNLRKHEGFVKKLLCNSVKFRGKLVDKLKFVFLFGLLFMACSSHPRYHAGPKPTQGFRREGIASYYGPKFHGRKTSSGEVFDMNALTAAHNTLPFGTLVKVTNLSNGLSVIVRINDRGPFMKNRIIDLSYEAARRIGMLGPGTAKVRLEIVKKGE